MSAEIRALTVRQPWAACIASGRKATENRRWPTKFRGRLLIHAGLGMDADALQISVSHAHMWRALKESGEIAFMRGAIVAVARVADCHLEDHRGCCAPWGETGPSIWHWSLTDIRPLDRPVECRGRQQLWRPDPAVLAAVLRQIEVAS